MTRQRFGPSAIGLKINSIPKKEKEKESSIPLVHILCISDRPAGAVLDRPVRIDITKGVAAGVFGGAVRINVAQRTPTTVFNSAVIVKIAQRSPTAILDPAVRADIAQSAAATVLDCTA